jgi:alkylation response protein AidB-like acyl-CoA dehydrogenase
MRFALSEDQALLRRSTRDFVAGALPLERTRGVMEHSKEGFEPGEWRRLAEMGYLALLLPASAGGQGLGAIELAIVLEEMGRVCAPGPYLDAVLAGALLATAGGHDDLAQALGAGRTLVVLARADAVFSGNHAAPARFAEGRVRGTKYFVPFAAQADALLVTTDAGVVLAAGPFATTPLPTLDLAQRFAEVALDHAATFVAPTALLARVDQLAAVGAAAMLLGVMSRALEVTLDYVRTRHAFNRPIGAFQALQHRMADMLLRAESTRAAVYRAAWCYDTRDPDAALACAAAKAYAGEAARRVCGDAIQMHGGIGFTWELDLHVFLKRAKTLEQHYGSTEEQLARALAAAGY